MKVLCIGNAAYDITYSMDDYPIENFKYRMKNKYVGGGGPSSNAAYLLGKWGAKTYFAGAVGDDTLGKKIIKEFKSVGVSTKYIEIDRGRDTTLAFILLNESKGSRTVFTYREDTLVLDKKIKEKFDYILMDGQEYEASMFVLDKNPNAISIIDAGRATEKVIELCKKVTYVVCSKKFAEDYTKMQIDINNNESMNQVLDLMLKDFKNVVITLEESGSIYKKDGILNYVPSIKVEVKDSTGAGDLFHGAFTYFLVNGYPFERIIKLSNITGALSVTKIGGRNSVPSLGEVLLAEKENV
ncbi:MAG: carbohydrate kinase family protein [Tenericutes bacterium]|jgi:sulfofructose kinase|nr:carbohydrate kinase family protein [Bacilli bacterium]NLV90694.1 carbohydrate kinase family protein [Mycoplasmatota bacterium]